MHCRPGAVGEEHGVFEAWKARKAAAAAAKAQAAREAAEQQAVAQRQDALANWQKERDEHAQELETAREFHGKAESSTVILEIGEAVFLEVANAGLVEPRKEPGEWQGRSQGVSIPIGSLGGRAVRYRVGASRGHFVPGAEKPTIVDTGTMVITNTRVVFVGAKETRECLFDKLIGYDHQAAWTTFSVSNRQKATVIAYGADVAPTVRFRLELAIACCRNDTDTLVKQLEDDLAAVDARKPLPAIAGTGSAPDGTGDPQLPLEAT
jgi:hypothetical protein